jgi:multiple sugar transport system ATP-binding protein
VIQQIGTPEEIYDRPKNTFVASFLGNPPINYLEGSLSQDGKRFMRGGISLPLPIPLPVQAGRAVRLGIRAEDVDPKGTGEQLGGRITSVLPVGSDQFLGVEVGGTTLFFRVGREVRVHEGENISLPVNANRLQVFDAASGASLLWQ